MDLIQCLAESFLEDQTDTTGTKHLLAISIISIGDFWSYDSVEDFDREQAKENGYARPTKKSKDGSQFFPQFALTAVDTGLFLE